MRHVIKKYVESCWWAFFLHSIIAIGFGLFAIFTPIDALDVLATVVAVVLMSMGVIELIRTLLDIRRERDWGLSLTISLIEVILGVWLLANTGAEIRLLTIAISGYMIVRGLFDIIIGLATLDDSTDRFMWVVAGIAGTVLGAVMISNVDTGSLAIIWIFGIYSTIFGLTNIIYSIHAKSTLQQIATEKRRAKAARKSRAKTKVTAKAATKKTVKTTKKAKK